MADRLQAPSFPFIAVLLPSRDGLMLLDRIDRPAGADVLLGRLRDVHARATGMLAAEHAVRSVHGAVPASVRTGARRLTRAAGSAQHVEDRRLREEQDEAFRRTLQMDREKERRRAEEEQRAAAEAQRLQQEEQARVQSAQAEQERRRAEQAEMERKRRELPPEPPADATGTTAIRIRMPDGTKLQRRFSASTPMQAVYDYISCESPGIGPFQLRTTMPARTFGDDEMGMTLRETGLVPNAALVVHRP